MRLPTFAFITFLCLLFCGLSACDCFEYVHGVVIDRHSGKPVPRGAITKSHKLEPGDSLYTVQFSDSGGIFDFHSVSGGLFGCPPLQLYFQHDGYQTAMHRYDCAHCGMADTIYLEPLPGSGK